MCSLTFVRSFFRGLVTQVVRPLFVFLPCVRYGGKEKNMKIKYEFVTGDVVEVEAPDEIGEFIKESRKAEHADDERNRLHNYSLEGALYEGREYGYYDSKLRRLESKETQNARILKKRQMRRGLAKGYSKLTEVQRRRFLMYADDFTVREIAEKEGVDHAAIVRSIIAARKKFKKYL